MKLYFLRHGLAENAVGGMRDYDRVLTPEGVKRMRSAARVMASLHVRPKYLYSSPLVRARQTAEIVARELKLEPIIQNRVGPGFDVEVMEALLAEHDDADTMFVGHEPDMSGVVSKLIGGGDVTMKKGSLARVDVVSRNPLRGTLIWLIAPRVFGAFED